MKKLPKNKWHPSQRGYFAGALYNEMLEDEDIYLLVGDLGYGVFDRIRDMFPDRFINCGASEQAMMGLAVGLALKGKKPFVYTITSFFMRAAETISLYVEHDQVPVRLVGSGRRDDYKHDGYSHNATNFEDFIFRVQDGADDDERISEPSIELWYPLDEVDVPRMVHSMVVIDRPAFISLRR